MGRWTGQNEILHLSSATPFNPLYTGISYFTKGQHCLGQIRLVKLERSIRQGRTGQIARNDQAQFIPPYDIKHYNFGFGPSGACESTREQKVGWDRHRTNIGRTE